MTKTDWESNITNLMMEVAAKCGDAVARSVLTTYGATSFEDLSPVYYWDVYGNLQQIAEDCDVDRDG